MMLRSYRCNVHSVYHQGWSERSCLRDDLPLLSIWILTDTTLYSLFSGMVVFGYLY